MPMKFRAHDTFFIRKGWLSKGMRNVVANRDVFVTKDKQRNPMDVLGIGANMVKALRYWLPVVGLTEENKIVSDSLISVPDELNNRFSSIKDLKDALLRVLSSQGMFASEENSVFYDVVLMVWRNGGPWVPGTKEGFADGPLTVKLEYTF